MGHIRTNPPPAPPCEIARLRDPFGKGGEFYIIGLFTRDCIPGYRQGAPSELRLWLAGYVETMKPRNFGTLEPCSRIRGNDVEPWNNFSTFVIQFS